MSEEAVLGANYHEIIDDLVARYAIDCPVLQVEAATMDPTLASMSVPPIRGIAGLDPRQVEAPRYELAVPYTGDSNVFFLTPNPISYGGPMPDVEIHPGRVLIIWHQPAEAADAARIRAWFDQQIMAVNSLLNQSRLNIEAFNSQLPGMARRALSDRRAKVQAARDVAGALGFPLKRRADAGDFEVPLKRRVLPSLPQPTSSAAAPEYKLGDADYEAALAVLERQRNALERSPSLTSKLNEELIRLLLLVGLNAVFEGKALGEVFNGRGKTDILIRVNDANIFVAECKIWDGPATVSGAIDQLLSYLTWRDTKGALLLFIRNANVTSVIGKAVTAIEGHRCFAGRCRELMPLRGGTSSCMLRVTQTSCSASRSFPSHSAQTQVMSAPGKLHHARGADPWARRRCRAAAR
jgi:hypothetical protein